MVAASALGLGGIAASAVVATGASADTAPVGGLPATVSADALSTEQINGVAWSQVTVGNTVYVTGSFSQARPAGVAVGGAGSVTRSNLLAYDITTGNLITSFNHSLNAQGLAIAASPNGSTVYVVGDFTKVDGATHNHIAAFSTATGALISTFTGNLNASTKTVTANNSTVYVGGAFTTANGVAHKHLAAFSSAGALLSWNPSTSASVSPTNSTATATVTAMVLAPDGSRVVIAGQFDHLDADARLGLGAVDTVTGADEPWAANNPIADYGATSYVTTLSADATQVYGGGFYYTYGGNFEGRFAVNPDTGAIIWMNTCHGDSYATFPMGQVLYSASHEHECSDIGAFSQTTPSPIPALHHFGEAETTYATGTLHPAIFTVGGGPTYYNFGGEPSGTQLDWYPTFTEGTYTGQNQAAWSVSGNSKYISYGGEFPTVNGTKQQGLVRFAISSIAPNKVGPTGLAAPTVVSQSSGTARIGWEAASDQDNTTLTYAVTRDSSTTAIYTTTLNSTFYNRPALSYVDKNLTPGSTHSYKVRVTDPFGNTVLSSATSVTISSSTVDPYTASVLASSPVAFWPLSEPAGSALAYDHAGGADLTMGAHGTFGVAGPHAGSTAVSFQGDPTVPGMFIPPATETNPVYSASTSGSFATAPPLATYSVEAWVKTTSTTGGLIAGDGLWQTNDSQIEDRVLYFDTSGDLRFGAFNDGATDAGQMSTIASPTPYNDGTWHHVVGSIGASGSALYVDGVKVASDPTMVDTSAYYGNWRVGGDALTGWPSAPTNGYLAGSIADVAIYPTALASAAVLSHYNGGAVGASAPIGRFTSTCTAESCAFNASTSSDTGGTITGYSWNFGDGSAVVTGTATPTHVYPTANTYNVTLTVTDNTASTDVVNHSVSPNFGTGSPVAAFTANCTGLSCAFDGSTSTDTGGTITTYSWNFGDGSPVVTGASPTVTHLYTTSSFYVPSLNVTDNTSSVSTFSNFLFPGSTGTPHAAFTSNCTALSCSFDGTHSTDAGGVAITTYSWNFGDGTTGSGALPTHIYAVGGTYTVTLTVTDSAFASNTVSNHVSPTGTPPPSTPVAAFTSNCTALSCAFTDASTDTGGTITGWSWDFGDGTAVSTDQNPTHVYASAGTGYTVKLTVTDNMTDTATISHNVAPTGPPPPSTPVAAFTTNCTLLSCAFTDTSTDTGGTITGWSWNFGDGSPVSTVQSPTHLYASGGTYTVSLTVTDDQLDSNTASTSVSPSSGVVTLFASDTFNRTVTGGLGTADLGGAWTRVGGVAADLSVAPGTASFLMPSPSVQDSAYLASVSETTSETDTTFTDTNVSTGTAGVYVYLDGRRVSTNNEYDARIRLTPAGGVAVELTKYAGSATATAIGSEVTLPGVTFTPGTLIKARFQVSGTSPTTLKVKVWAAASPEPAAWTITTTDNTAGLQAAGAVGLTTYLSGSTTNAPTTVRFTTFTAGPLQP